MNQAFVERETMRQALRSLSAMRQRLAIVDRRTAAAFVLPFTLYLFTLAPTIYNLDSAELTTAAATGGIVRATGYPLYLLLGRIWSWIPIGDVGYRMNLLSAFSGALTLTLADLILRRLQVGPWAAWAALGLLATAPFFWAMSLIAEVYTLHTLLMAAIILLLLNWADEPSPRRLGLVGLVLGLSMGNHAATVLLLPGCAWYMITVAPRRALASRSLLLAAVGLLGGLGIYLYLPLRYSTSPAFNYASQYNAMGVFVPVNLGTLDGLWWLVSGQTFTGEMFAYGGVQLWGEVLNFGQQLWRAFLAVGVGPGLLGMAVLLRRDWRLGGMLLLMFALTAGFYIDYAVVDKDTMFLPAYLVWALWLGFGIKWLMEWLRRDGDARTQKWGVRAIRASLSATLLIAVAWTWQLTDLSDDWSARTRGEAILDIVKPDALIFGWWDTVPVIEYLQHVEGQRPDVRAINRFLIKHDDMRLLIQREAANRPVYIDRPTDDLLEITRMESVGPLYRLRLRNAGTSLDGR